jgi:hypothetical protein
VTKHLLIRKFSSRASANLPATITGINLQYFLRRHRHTLSSLPPPLPLDINSTYSRRRLPLAARRPGVPPPYNPPRCTRSTPFPCPHPPESTLRTTTRSPDTARLEAGLGSAGSEYASRLGTPRPCDLIRGRRWRSSIRPGCVSVGKPRRHHVACVGVSATKRAACHATAAQCSALRTCPLQPTT